MNIQPDEIEESSGNVFADLGLPDADGRLVKAELAQKISQIMTQRQLTQIEAAELLGIDQSKVSALLHGRLLGFSLERLIRFLNLLGQDVQIVVKPKPYRRPHATLAVRA